MENPIAGYFIWNASPEIFSFNGFSLRWNALLVIVAFLISRQILLYICKKEGKPAHTISVLCIYLVFAAIIGARLGYMIFYEPRAIVSKGFSIIFPFAFEPDFHVLDASEFSVHGATWAVMIFLWLYSRKRRALWQTTFHLLDRVALVSVFAGTFLLAGNFISSGIKGKPTASPVGTVAVSPIERGLMKVPCCIMRSPDGKNPLQRAEVRKDPTRPKEATAHKSMIIYLFFQPGASERLVNEFLIGDVKTFLYEMALFVHEPGDQPLNYRIFLEKNGNYIARIQTKGISRYPVQLFEAVSCLAIFLFLWRYRSRMKHAGGLFGVFMVLFWSFHAGYGFLFAAITSVEIVLNVLFVLTGVGALVLSNRKSHASDGVMKNVPEKGVTL